MWTTANRPKYNRDKLRYPSDLTGEEWAHIEALIPAAKHGGRKRKVDVREVVNGRSKLYKQRLRRVMYVLSTGCQWRYLPKDLPPKSTLYDYFDLWTYDGTLENIHHALYVKCREQIGREASPAAAIIDRKTREKRRKRGRCIDPPCYDAGKKINGKKRHILVDTLGLLLHAIVHPADIQDRPFDELRRRHARSLDPVRHMYPFLQKLFADGGHQGPVFQKALAKALPHLEIEIVKRPDHAKGFEVLPQRWVVERPFAWFNRCRRLAKDFENLTRNALAFLRLASIRLMLRKLCNQ
ncbi:MAG: IS5 family transposase [Candidatus Acidiferrum sp.]